MLVAFGISTRLTNCMTLVSKNHKLMSAYSPLKKAGLYIKDQGHPADYIGVNIKRNHDGTYKFTQCAVIDAIIDDVDNGNFYTELVPTKASLQLHAFHDSPKFDGNFKNFLALRKLNCLGQTSRPDILHAAHQPAKYSAEPRPEHGEAIEYIVKYVRATCHVGIHFKPDASKGFHCYYNTDFAGNWNKEFTAMDPSISNSRNGWIVFYAACPIIWASKLQSQVALSMT
ncbi:hypothetical protein ACHAW6_008977 [Cyclotella cf. meneghiniana]